MTDLRCAARCGRPAKTGVICAACAHRLRTLIEGAAELRTELEVDLTRRQRRGPTGIVTVDEQPIPYAEHAATALRKLDEAFALARYRLGGYAGVDLRGHPAAGNTLERLAKATAKAVEIIDRPEERRYAGTCGFDEGDREACLAELYAPPEDAYIDCPSCGTRWDVEERRAVLLDVVRDQHAYAELLERALDQLDIRVQAGTIRQWKRRKRLTPVDVDVKGRPLYRVGDVLDLVAEEERRITDLLSTS